MHRKTNWSVNTLIEAFEAYLRSSCGLSDRTCRSYARHARDLLRGKYGKGAFELKRLEPIDLIRFVSDRATRYKPATAQRIATALRSFLRFLQFEGHCSARLIDAVPTIPHWKLSNLPSSLTDEQIPLLLAAFDRSKATGLRDYAIALCLLELGLRAGEVAHLSLDHIDWRNGILRIEAGKTRRTSLLPLPKSVGRAIVTYLRTGRPPTHERRIFVRRYQPKGTPISGSAIRRVINRAVQRAGIDAPSKGSHILRHTLATRMIRAGASFKEIADVLRHKSIDTTAIYAKVDLPRLAEVAMPWPEVL